MTASHRPFAVASVVLISLVVVVFPALLIGAALRSRDAGDVDRAQLIAIGAIAYLLAIVIVGVCKLLPGVRVRRAMRELHRVYPNARVQLVGVVPVDSNGVISDWRLPPRHLMFLLTSDSGSWLSELRGSRDPDQLPGAHVTSAEVIELTTRVGIAVPVARLTEGERSPVFLTLLEQGPLFTRFTSEEEQREIVADVVVPRV